MHNLYMYVKLDSKQGATIVHIHLVK